MTPVALLVILRPTNHRAARQHFEGGIGDGGEGIAGRAPVPDLDQPATYPSLRVRLMTSPPSLGPKFPVKVTVFPLASMVLVAVLSGRNRRHG